MYARVPQSMAQFVLKIEKLSHIMGTAPIVELARAYGLQPRLWLLLKPMNFKAIMVWRNSIKLNGKRNYIYIVSQ